VPPSVVDLKFLRLLPRPWPDHALELQIQEPH
jgi:hypothetical protein